MSEIEATSVTPVESDDLPEAQGDGSPAIRTCRNCGELVEQSHCPACGQDYATAERLSLKDAVIEAVQVFHFNGVVTRDFRQLLTKPGGLTLDYLEGRRVRHLTPGRLFFLVYVLFFFVIQNIGGAQVEGVKASIGEERLAEIAAAKDWSLAVLDARLDAALSTAYAMWFFILLPPLVAAVTLLHVQSRKPIVIHGVFVLHVLAFVMLVNIPDMLMPRGEVRYYLYWFVNLLIIPTYLFVALRAVYAQGFVLTALKTAALWLAIMWSGWRYVDWVVAWSIWTL